MMGFKNASAVVERTGRLAQTVGVGAMVADAAKDNPKVKQALEKGGERAKEISRSINRSVKQKSEQIRRSIKVETNNKK